MCHIPVLCWISATVLERILDEAVSADIPKTLNEMCTHFLIFLDQTVESEVRWRAKWRSSVDEGEHPVAGKTGIPATRER